MHRVIGLLVCCAWLWCGACSSPPSAPSGALDGTWAGTMTGDASDSAVVTLVLAQTGAGVSGTFAITRPSAADRTGVVTGTLAAPVVLLTFSSPMPLVCSPTVTLSGALSATMTLNGSRMTGTYSAFTCGGAIGGSIDLTRR